jgi:hypothetical protein
VPQRSDRYYDLFGATPEARIKTFPTVITERGESVFYNKSKRSKFSFIICWKDCYGRKLPKMTMLIAAQHSFLDAVGLNNEAVSMIAAAGDTIDQKAIQLLQRSISIMKKTSAAVRQCSGQAYNTSLASSAAPAIHHHHHETVSLPHTIPDQRWFLYNKALRFSTEIVSLASFLEDFHTFSAVVAFNLALIYHRSALCGNHKFAPLSGRATSLYSLVLKLVLDWPGWISSRTSPMTCTIVRLAATNNLAQISSESGDTKLAQDFLKHLSAGIRQSRKHFPCLFQTSGDMFELMISLLFWLPDTVVAPAA